MQSLANKVAIVTGGADGIGEATCYAFAQQNVAVIIADKNLVRAKVVAENIIQQGGQALAVFTNTTCENSIAQMIQAGVNAFGKINILINCAAAFIMKGIDATAQDWLEVMQVNIMGYALCAKYAVKEMQKVGSGAIVNVGSISGSIAQSNFITYSATKGAVISMTRCMAFDLAPHKIRVNAVSPGTVWTSNTEQFIKNHYQLEREEADQHPELGGAYMLKRCANPAEIADVILFLASDRASFITAENIMVDGGYTAK